MMTDERIKKIEDESLKCVLYTQSAMLELVAEVKRLRAEMTKRNDPDQRFDYVRSLVLETEQLRFDLAVANEACLRATSTTDEQKFRYTKYLVDENKRLRDDLVRINEAYTNMQADFKKMEAYRDYVLCRG